jgi:hypothetical protein
MVTGMVGVGLGIDQEHDRFVSHFFDRRRHPTRVQRAVAAIDHHNTRLRDYEAACSRALVWRESVDTVLDLVKARTEFLSEEGRCPKYQRRKD